MWLRPSAPAAWVMGPPDSSMQSRVGAQSGNPATSLRDSSRNFRRSEARQATKAQQRVTQDPSQCFPFSCATNTWFTTAIHF